jgi:putative membrane protein
MTKAANRYTLLCTTLTLFTASLLGAQTAATAAGSAGTEHTATGQNGAAQSGGDKAFVKNALEGGNAEIQLGKLAQQKGQSDDVKQFGEKMVTDHTQMAEQMKPIAQQLNVSPSTGIPAKDKMLYSKLEKMSGADFDREYIMAMVKDHQKDLSEFKKEASSGKDPQVKQAAEQGSSIISEHLSMAKQMAQKHNVNVGGAGGQ